MIRGLKKLRYYARLFGSQGVKLAVQERLGLSPAEIAVRAPGLRVQVLLRPSTSDIPTFEQVFVHTEYGFALDHEPRTIVDAGANIGLTSMYFANRWPSARILAIEPEATNFELLKRNVADLPQVTPLRGALWNENGSIDLVDPGQGNWGFQTRRATGDVVAKDRVPAMTVDRLMDDHGFARVDLLKIDIEGAEKEVFENASAWIGRVGTIIVELHDRFKPGCSRSFYNATTDFGRETHRGHSVLVARAP